MSLHRIEHILPPNGSRGPVQVTILVPALNEQITVGEFVDWCREGLERIGLTGQILIVDSSTDETPRIALEHGAEILKVPRRGLGRAYLDAIPYVRGAFVIMGDADLTYDFRELEPFVEKLAAGYEFVMGSRFAGTIDAGAMPSLHRYFGTPLTTWLLNTIYGSRFSDINCGMRGVTANALRRMRLRSQSWQYASEMIIKALHLELRTCEVPVTFHRDREGRFSHLKRTGPFAAWHAGWITLQTMLTYGVDAFLFVPGLVLGALGLVGTAILYNGPLELGPIGLSLHWMLVFLVAYLVGLQMTLMGIMAKTICDLEQRNIKRWEPLFGFNRSAIVSLALLAAGAVSISGLVGVYFAEGLRLSGIQQVSYRAVAGLGLMVTGFIYFTFALLFNVLRTYLPGRRAASDLEDLHPEADVLAEPASLRHSCEPDDVA